MPHENETTISARVDGATAGKLKELAAKLNITRAELLFHIVKKFFKDNNL